MRHIFILLSAFAISTPAIAKKPSFDPRHWHGQQAGQQTRMLTLGSAHLAQLSKPIEPALLEPLIDRLAKWRPDIITHEGISGEQCDVLQRYAKRYPEMWNIYCWGTEEAQAATGLNVAQAMAAIETMLKDWPVKPTSAQRRRLAVLFLAANDRMSAQVQWLQLPESERVAAPDIDARLMPMLVRTGRRNDESFGIAVALAARLGHQRVYAVDDHTADSIQGLSGPGLDETMKRLWRGTGNATTKKFEAMTQSITTTEQLLGLYRFLNQPKVQRDFITADHIAAMRDDAPGYYGRHYLAWWETRNLRMVANIRAAAGNRPGGRVLNIVGASHKPYYDAYLSMMSDVVVDDVEVVLK